MSKLFVEMFTLYRHSCHRILLLLLFLLLLVFTHQQTLSTYRLQGFPSSSSHTSPCRQVDPGCLHSIYLEWYFHNVLCYSNNTIDFKSGGYSSNSFPYYVIQLGVLKILIPVPYIRIYNKTHWTLKSHSAAPVEQVVHFNKRFSGDEK